MGRKIFSTVPISAVWLLIVLQLVTLQQTVAQNSKIVDSLENLLKTKTGKDRWDPLYELAFEYVNKDPKHALNTIDEAYQVSLLGTDSLKIVKSLRVKAHLLGTLNNREGQLALLKEALPIASRNNFTRDEALMLNNLGNLYVFSSEFDKALETHLRTLEINRERHDTSDITSSLNNLGLIYYKISNYRKAIDYFEASYRLGVLASISSQEVVLPLLNIAISKIKIEDISGAEGTQEEAEKLCTSNCYDQYAHIFYFNKGALARIKNQLADARSCHLASLALSRKNNVKRFELDNINALARIEIESDNLSEANKWLNAAALILKADQYLLNESLSYYELRSKYYSKAGAYKKSRDYEHLYGQLLNKLFNRSWASRMMEIEEGHLNKEHQKALDSQTQIAALREEVIFRQKVANGLMGAITLMLLVIGYFLFVSVRNKKRANLYLEGCVRNRTNELLENRNELLRLNLESAAKMCDLHSRLKQSLATLSGLGHLASDGQAVEKSIEPLVKITQEIRGVLTQLSHNGAGSDKNDVKSTQSKVSQVSNQFK
jgi:hypothetical protein